MPTCPFVAAARTLGIELAHTNIQAPNRNAYILQDPQGGGLAQHLYWTPRRVSQVRV
ncbi:MAG: hypothetical protein K6T75_01045 [Acetobacteraceae bacterium]|nr:hypothetical protein [Acetobacteraceae bacterium]